MSWMAVAILTEKLVNWCRLWKPTRVTHRNQSTNQSRPSAEPITLNQALRRTNHYGGFGGTDGTVFQLSPPLAVTLQPAAGSRLYCPRGRQSTNISSNIEEPYNEHNYPRENSLPYICFCSVFTKQRIFLAEKSNNLSYNLDKYQKQEILTFLYMVNNIKKLSWKNKHQKYVCYPELRDGFN